MTAYIAALMRSARFEKTINGTYYGSISHFSFLIVAASTEEGCYAALHQEVEGEVLRLLGVNQSLLPIIAGVATPTLTADVEDVEDIPFI